MFRCTGFYQRMFAAFLLCLIMGLLSVAAAAQPNRQLALSRINDLMHHDLRAEALPLCRQYTRDFPADANMLYNLACLENTVGDRAKAEDAYIAALQAGFSEFEVAATDPDLQGDLHNVIVTLSEAEQARLSALASTQALSLDRDVWSEPRDLIPHGPTVITAATPITAPQLRLRWQENGLSLEITADSEWADALATDMAAPWNGGAGLLLSLSLPDGTSDWESANHFLFAFGSETKGGVGGMFVTSQGHWQPVAELVPKFKVLGESGLRLTATIPWATILPYDPVVDTPLGINATLVVPSGASQRRASLVETADTMNPLAHHRRFAQLDFRTDSIDGDQFTGKLNDSLSRDNPLDLDLVAVSTVAGDATLSLNFMDQAGRSVLPEGPITGKLALKVGTNNLHRQADFRSLKAGGYILQAELTFPSGRTQKWGATVLHLPGNWQQQYQERAALVALNEQATVRYLLKTVTVAITNHQPRRNPGAIVSTLLDLDQMLAAAEENGTILPDKGSFVMIYPGPHGQDRLCRLYLPAGREHSDGLNPILMLGYAGGQEARMAARIGRNYEFGTQKPTLKSGEDKQFPVYLVPELRPDRSDLPTSLLAEATACRRWAQDYFQTTGVSLVGIDDIAATALQMVKQAPHTARALLIFAGSGLSPWPQAQPEFIRQQLGPPLAELPITWVDFEMETDDDGQAREILQALKTLGYQITTEQKVRGSLHLTQVADRTVRWAEGLH